MAVSKQTYKRLEPIINQINKSVICQAVTNNGDGTYTFDCNYTKWATAGFNVTIGLVTYTITDFVCNESITVRGASLPTVLTFDLYPPIFKHGTILKVSGELNKLKAKHERTPMIFLHEILEENKHLDPLDVVDNDVDVRMYFLTEADNKNWSQEDAAEKGVQPMINLCNEFIKAASVSQYLAPLTGSGNVKPFPIFGNTTENGTVKNIFNEVLSGVQLKISLSFLKDCDCCTGSTLDNRPAPSYVYDLNGTLLATLYSNQTYTTGTPCAGVDIIDVNTGDVIAVVVSGGSYNVEVLTEIVDTIDSNTSTIIDPIN